MLHEIFERSPERVNESDSSCVSTGAPYLDGFALTHGGVVVSIRDDDTPWALAEIPW